MVPQCIQITIMIEKAAIQDWSRMDSGNTLCLDAAKYCWLNSTSQCKQISTLQKMQNRSLKYPKSFSRKRNRLIFNDQVGHLISSCFSFIIKETWKQN